MAAVDSLTCPLTPRQLDTARLLASGMTTAEAAEALGVTPSTVKTNAHEARKRLGLVGTGRAALYNVLITHGWMEKPEPVVEVPGYGTWLQGQVNDWAWKPSAAQRVYLTAFDRLLRQRNSVNAAALRAAFALMCWEAGVKVTPRPPLAAALDVLDDVLLGIARGVMRPIPA